MSDATVVTDETAEVPGTTESPEQEPSTESELVASYRRRQAGAEAARQAAEKKAAEADARVADMAKRLAQFEAQNRSAEDAERSEVARLQAQLEEANRRAEQAGRDAEARILDAKYPAARKELPEVTDEVRLAKFEAMLREDEVTEAQEPETRGANPPRSAGTKTTSKEMSSADIEAQLRSMATGW